MYIRKFQVFKLNRKCFKKVKHGKRLLIQKI